MDLWRRIAAFELDARTGSAPFSKKLAQSQKWSAAYTERAIKEYRRFVYLTQVSDIPVTPSKVVDQVWHMHLTFTQNYWDGLCGEILGKPLHHNPCEGEEDMPRYRTQFAQTLRSYRREFGEAAPVDVWGDRHAMRKFMLGVGIAVAGIVSLVVVSQVQDWARNEPLALCCFGLVGVGISYAVWQRPAGRFGARGGGQACAALGGHDNECGGCGGGGCGD